MTRFLRRILAGVLNDMEVANVVSAFDQMGDIIIIRIPPEIYDHRNVIGDVLLENIKVARAVFCQISDVSGEYRTRRLERIAGEGGPVTKYRENGCWFDIDAERVFFTPRLSTERARVAGLVQPHETVLNMFGGAGLYSIQAARRTPCVVYNMDINPEATRLCAQNILHNKMTGSVIPVTYDAMQAYDVISDRCDRVIMPLPERSREFAKTAVRITQDGGIIHYYSHIHVDRKQEAAWLAARMAVKEIPCDIEVLYSGVVRAVGPRYYQTVADVRILKDPICN